MTSSRVDIERRKEITTLKIMEESGAGTVLSDDAGKEPGENRTDNPQPNMWTKQTQDSERNDKEAGGCGNKTNAQNCILFFEDRFGKGTCNSYTVKGVCTDSFADSLINHIPWTRFEEITRHCEEIGARQK